jgi:hypothetical protein
MLGHWITQVAVNLNSSNSPFVLRMIPIITSAKRSETTPVSSLVKEAVNIINRQGVDTILIADSYYLDFDSRKYLQEQNIRYLCAVHPKRFSHIFKDISDKVKNPGDYKMKYNKQKNELGVVFLREDETGSRSKKLLLTTALKVNKNLSHPPLAPPGAFVYNKTFGTCDLFNNIASKHTWPFRRGDFKRNIDEFFFLTLIINIYSLMQEVVQDKRPFVKFCRDEAQNLLETARLFKLQRDR